MAQVIRLQNFIQIEHCNMQHKNPILSKRYRQCYNLPTKKLTERFGDLNDMKMPPLTLMGRKKPNASIKQ